MLSVIESAHSTVIGFEDLTSRDNFTHLGIVDTYQGYEWGYGNGPGVFNRTFVTDTSDGPGWAAGTISDAAWSPAPAGMGGTSYAWNWNGPQSLWIDFRAPTDVASVNLAVLSSTYNSYNSSTVQIFGYDANDILVGSSGILDLTTTFQTLAANFFAINYLEIRADRDGSWFSVDNLVLNENISGVPDSGSVALLLSLGLAGVASLRRLVNA